MLAFLQEGRVCKRGGGGGGGGGSGGVNGGGGLMLVAQHDVLKRGGWGVRGEG